MFVRLRTALLAGTLIFVGAPAAAEPISLGEALSQGRAASPRITRAEAEVRAAEGRALQAGLSLNPSIGLDVENFSGTGPYRSFRQSETTLAVSQEFELGGKRRARKAVAAAELDFARLALSREVAALEYDIRVAHAELAASEARGALARETLGRARELSRVAKELVDAGRDPPLRRLRADALLAEAEAELARAAGAFISARRKLALLAGSGDSELTAAPGKDEPIPALPAETPSLDERLATAEREAAQARVSLAKAEAVPNVTASGGVRRFRESGATAVVASVSIPLPFRNRNQGNVSAARAETEAAEAFVAQMRLEATFNRRDAELMVTAANERVNALSGPGLAQAEEAARLADIGYRAGKFSLIELIDAQEALNSARRNLIEAQLDRARALAALARANAQ